MNCELNSVILLEMPGTAELRALPIQSTTHALLMDVPSLTGHYVEEVLCWMAELFLQYSQGTYRLTLEPFCDLLIQVRSMTISGTLCIMLSYWSGFYVISVG